MSEQSSPPQQQHDTAIETLAVIFLVMILCVALFEAGILFVSFVFADKVECNWMWCTFTTEKHSSILSQDCYQNGEQVNCSEIIMFPDADEIEKMAERWT